MARDTRTNVKLSPDTLRAAREIKELLETQNGGVDISLSAVVRSAIMQMHARKFDSIITNV